MKYNVTVYFIDTSLNNTLSTTEKFSNATSAREYAEEELAWENTLRVVCPELDIDESGDLPAQYGIRGVPTMILFDANDKEVGRLVGMATEAKIKEFISG